MVGCSPRGCQRVGHPWATEQQQQHKQWRPWSPRRATLSLDQSGVDVTADYKESWAPKNWCFWTVVLEKALESPLDCKEIKPVNPKGNQPWIFIGRTDAQGETPILWPPDVKKWLTGKGPDAGQDWRQEKETTEDETVGWHHWLDRHEFEQAPGSLARCSPWGRKGSDTTEWLNWLTVYPESGLFTIGHGMPLKVFNIFRCKMIEFVL